MKVLILGGSRNIGYDAGRRLLVRGATVTFLLRFPTVFDNDPVMKPYVESGQARLVQGDATKEEDVRKAWAKAGEGEDGRVDFVICSVGGTPSFHPLKGFVIENSSLCTTSILNLLSTYPTTTPPPKFIALSSHGVSRKTHAQLPLLVRPLYAMIWQPHADKLGLERLISHAAGWDWKDNEVSEQVLERGWESKLPTPGILNGHALIIRPSLLKDGDAKADSGGSYRADSELDSAYTITRKDVAHFIAEQVIPNWSEWENKRGVSVSY